METNVGDPLRIAYFSPLPPARSGIADYSAELLPHLVREFDVTLFVNNPTDIGGELATTCAVEPLPDYAASRNNFDLTLYQLGNSRLHDTIYDMALRYPGVVVLHDYVLHHFIGDRTAGQGDFAGYGRELAYALGANGVQLAEAIRRGWTPPPTSTVPLNDRIVDLSLGIIVHSHFVADALLSRGHQAQIVPALIPTYPGRSRRAELKLPDDSVIFGVFGQLTPYKQIPLILETFSRLHQEMPQAHLLLVGEVQLPDLAQLDQNRERMPGVHWIGFVPDLQDFVDWIHTADIVVNLRNPTMGESSATALRGMAAARPVIVFDHGWYAELPPTAVSRIPPGDPEALLPAMRELASKPELRRAMGANARLYVDSHCDPAEVARAYAAALRKTLADVLSGK